MKFNFVGILCCHALKVLDKKNVRRIPAPYILNRWSKEAKARSITNYHAAKSSANPEESIGKRYSHLCRNYREIASVAAEHEELTKYAHEYSIELLKNLEEKKKRLLKDKCLNQTSEHHDVVLGELPKACGVKRKATVGRPRGSGSGYGRYKGVLEGIKPIAQVESYASISPVRKVPAKKQLSFQVMVRYI
jgi:zinc finger SWIM domain-containing protein 3